MRQIKGYNLSKMTFAVTSAGHPQEASGEGFF